MTQAPILETQRLILRHWKKKDLIPFAALNADPKVMEFFPKLLSKKESDEFVARIEKELLVKKYGLWALEVKKGPKFIGFVGLHKQDIPFDCIEIGWRIAYHSWRKGFAFEAATKVLEYAFSVLQLKEIVSFTAKINLRSIKLMKKLGMSYHEEDDFFHPKLPLKHPLSEHVLLRLHNRCF